MAPSKTQLLGCFIGSNLVALGAGTPYLFSFYAPQLLERCKIPISQSSTLSFSMTIGSGALGFLAGIIIDKNPQASCGLGAFCTFLAYGILRWCYIRGESSLWIISVALVLVGFGSVSGFYASVKCCTTNFPKHRGTAGAFPVSLYALAGLLYSSICAWLFQDRVDEVFTFLMVVCSCLILVGCFTLRILVTHRKIHKRANSSVSSEGSSSLNLALADAASNASQLPQPINISGSRSSKRDSRDSFGNYRSLMKRSMSRISNSDDSLLSFGSVNKNNNSYVWAKELPGSLSFWGWGKARPSDSNISFSSADGIPSSSQQDYTGPSSVPVSLPETPNPRALVQSDRRDSLLKQSSSTQAPIIQEEMEPATEPFIAEQEIKKSFRDNHIYQTVTQPKFMAYYLILATLQGIGQTYIYSVGFVVEALVHSNPDAKVNIKAIQSLQVSIISIMSFAGRICSGPVSDLLVKRLRAQREWCILVACALMFYGSQQLISDISSVTKSESTQNIFFIKNVSITSFIFGFAFGITFGTFPAIIADQFGTEGFSTIWGLCTTGGIISVKLFSALFANDLSENTSPNDSVCDKGSLCYSYTFDIVKKFAILVALMNLVLITIRYYKKTMKARQLKHNGVFILDEDDDSLEE
ncbi:LADA_0C02630g1_1 [Lachancea dasiensis]|uniref:LADA_0C02630g1_1 n=1 Tax=Lachancea dasiensis TaxID=1072105 RepID=A0A1G4IY16_9SACH|nr:LADA_0C02630g1_1 [Lachancea dasiensis]